MRASALRPEEFAEIFDRHASAIPLQGSNAVTILGVTATAMETNYLVPDPLFAFLALLTFVVLVVWPLAHALRTRDYPWAIAIVLLAPLGGLAWLAWHLSRRLTRAGV